MVKRTVTGQILLKADTDGDGATDGAEILSKDKPLRSCLKADGF